jgi:transposase
MIKRVTLRSLSAEEKEEIERLARSRTVEARQAERVKVIRLASQGCGTTEIARQVQRTRPRILTWIKRFNAQGLSGLEDEPRSGRPRTYSVEQVSVVVATALTAPQTLS